MTMVVWGDYVAAASVHRTATGQFIRRLGPETIGVGHSRRLVPMSPGV